MSASAKIEQALKVNPGGIDAFLDEVRATGDCCDRHVCWAPTMQLLADALSAARAELLDERDRMAEALLMMADEDAWSMNSHKAEKHGLRSGPWFFDPLLRQEDLPDDVTPWEFALAALSSGHERGSERGSERDTAARHHAVILQNENGY